MSLIFRYNISTLADNHTLMAKEGSHLLLIDLSKRYGVIPCTCKCWLLVSLSVLHLRLLFIPTRFLNDLVMFDFLTYNAHVRQQKRAIGEDGAFCGHGVVQLDDAGHGAFFDGSVGRGGTLV